MKRVLALAVIAALFVFSGAAAGDTGVPPGGTLIVGTLQSPDSTIVALGWGEEAPMANIELDVPAGYTFDAGQPVGAHVADVVLLTSTFGIAEGALTTADPATPSSCDPQPHVAVWMMSITAVGPAITAPWFLDAGAGGGYAIHTCLPPSAFGAAGTPIQELLLSFDSPSLHAPPVAGRYLWRALVTPFGADGQTADALSVTELQANVPLPVSLTMKATYDARAKDATVTGRMMLAGQPADGYTLDIGVTATADGFPTVVGTAETLADGTFNFPTHLEKSAYIVAIPEPVFSTCTSAVAKTCTETELPLVQAVAHVVVTKAKPAHKHKPKPKKPKHKRKR